jgi:hypothetical protein
VFFPTLRKGMEAHMANVTGNKDTINITPDDLVTGT